MTNPWIKAARLRTLPLAISGIILGWAVSYPFAGENSSRWEIFFFALITAILLQITSNYANDYGDFEKGVDQAAGRTDRMLASGKISPSSMKLSIVILSLLTLFTGIQLLNSADVFADNRGWILLVVGVFAILAAIFYTVGNKAYGYNGWGDVFVFGFFGLTAVLGVCLLLNAPIGFPQLSAAIGMGCLSTAVLNINNYRDIPSDEAKNKRTLAVVFGAKRTLQYQGFLLVIGLVGVVISLVILQHDYFQWSQWIKPDIAYTLGLFFPFVGVLNHQYVQLKSLEPGDREGINPLLKKLSLTILALVIAYSLLVFFMAPIAVGSSTIH